MTIYLVAVLCAIGDVILAAHLLKERRAHRFTKTALRYWRQEDTRG